MTNRCSCRRRSNRICCATNGLADEYKSVRQIEEAAISVMVEESIKLNWMRKTVFVLAVLCIGVVSSSTILTTSAADTGLIDPNQPGSVNDPLVTKSYVDEALKAQVQAEISGQLEEQLAQIDAKLAEKEKQMENQIAQFEKKLDALLASAGGMTVVELQPKQTLFANEGTSLIVRNGSTIAVSTDENGIPDVTGGKDLMDGTPVELNHMLLFPREGRGIKSTHSSTVYVMVMGGFTVMNEDGTVDVSSSGTDEE